MTPLAPAPSVPNQRRRVFGAFAVVILPLIVLAAATLWHQHAQDEEIIAADRVQLARATAFATESFIEGHLSTARTIALHAAVRAAEASPELQAFVNQVAAANPEWQGLGIVGADGHTLLGSTGVSRVYLGDRPYFQEAMATGRPVVSPVIIGRVSGKATVILAVPFHMEKTVNGVLIVALPTDRFAAALKARAGTPEVQITVLDRLGQLFISPDESRLTTLKRASGPEVEAVQAGRTGTLRVQRDGRETLVAFAPAATYGLGVLLYQDAAAAFAPVRSQALVRAGILAAILAGVMVLGWFVGGWLSDAYQRESAARASAESLSRDLRRAVETRDQFLASASHDLRNPLGAIQAAGETLARSSANGGVVPRERLEACVQHITRSARRMAGLLDEFMDVAQLQLGRPIELDRQTVDFIALAREVVAECAESSPRHRLRFAAPDQATLRGDPRRLQRALSNIIGNAIKYSPAGGDIGVEVRRDETGLSVAVRDRGIGIPAADLERVFERFERGSNVTGRFPGTGLGLSGARQIIEQHGGALTATSIPGEGTTVAFRIPMETELECATPSLS